MSDRKFRHLGRALDVKGARDAGGLVRVLCGRRIRPLSADVLDSLPICGICAHLGEVTYTYTVSTVQVWTDPGSSLGDVA